MPADDLKIAIKGTTQDHLPIEDIIDGIVILKDGSAAAVMRVSSVNFDLLSEKEQSALVFAYGGILNSLNFPIEIIIHTQAKDVSGYLNNLKTAEEKQTNQQLRERISSYRRFVEETVKKNKVLSKSFYIVAPFSTLELGLKGVQKQMSGQLMPWKKSPEKLPFDKKYILEKAKASLEPKKDHLVRLFSRLGLEIKALETKELIELFYKIYNEETAGGQKVQTLAFETPLVTART